MSPRHAHRIGPVTSVVIALGSFAITTVLILGSGLQGSGLIG